MNNHTRCYSCMAPLDVNSSVCPTCGYDPASEPDSSLYLPQGYILNNRYLIGRVIGVGGFGIVYAGWDNNLDVRVAVKEFLAKDYAARSVDHITITPYTGSAMEEHTLGIEKFIDEAKALARFQDHPGIVKVNESFRANNTAYMIMQFLDGMTLKEYLKRQPGEKMSFDMAVKAMIPIMDALREVHKAGFVHRDISPDNIFITRQKQIKLLDFGSARYAIGEHSKSLSVVLKHGYAPPEQYSTKGHQGPWSDVYAVAATIYRCVTGQVPPDSMERLQGDTIKSPKQLGIDIPLSGELALMRALEIKASARFESIKQFQQALMTGEMAASPASAGEENVIQPNRPQPKNVVECPECGAKNQLNPGDDPNALRCGRCKRELGVNPIQSGNHPSGTAGRQSSVKVCPDCKSTGDIFTKLGDGNYKCEECGSIIGTSENENIPVMMTFKSISYKSYMIAILGGFVFGLFMMIASNDNNDTLAGFGVLLLFGAWSFAYIYHFVALYRCWAILQGSTARTTPGSAVGRMFIPFYNLYWVFIAFKGLADDANKFAEKYGVQRRINADLSVAVSICSILPYINILVTPFLFIFLIYQWSMFYEEVSVKWSGLKVRRDPALKPTETHTAIIVCVVVFFGIALLGIIAAIAIPQFTKYKNKSRNSEITPQVGTSQIVNDRKSSNTSNEDNKTIAMLEKEAKEYNATLPNKVADNVTMDKVTVGPGKMFTFFSTITDVSASDLDITVFSDKAKPELVKAWCEDADIKTYFLKDVTLVASYYGKDRSHIADIHVTREDCGY